MSMPGCEISTDSSPAFAAEIIHAVQAGLSEAAQQEVARIAAEISLEGMEDDPDVVTACYLCHGQCTNFGVHGKSVRPCAKGVASILARHRQARLSRGGESRTPVAN